MSEKLQKLLFLISLLAISFAYGFISHWKQIFPYQFLQEARLAYHALVELYFDDPKNVPGVDFWDDSGLTMPKAHTLSQDAGEEKIFFLGNKSAHQDLCPEEGCLAWIADREGNILHAWKNAPGLWDPLENREAIKEKWFAYPVGSYLYPNGDILVSYQGKNVFPIPMGLAKFDKDSKLIWKRNGYYHHWFSVDAEGRIYIPSAKIVDSPFRLNDHDKYFMCEEKRFFYEPIAILDSDGNLIKEIDTYKALIESDLAGVFNSNRKEHYEIKTCDPMHLNDVRILSEKTAHKFPNFEPGDLLLSFRSLNGIGVLDPNTNLFKWFYVGAVHHQHSPRFQGDNRVLIFDNLGGAKSLGISRVVGVDVSSGRMQTVFPKSTFKIPTRPFFSETAGHIDVHPDQRRMLVSWTHQGLVWEVDIESGEVLWEYVNTHPVGNQFGRVPVYTSTYVNKLYFPLNRGKIP